VINRLASTYRERRSDYDRLKRSLQFFVDQYVPANSIQGYSYLVQLLEQEERHSMMLARRSLLASIGDFVNATHGFSIEHILAADAELEERDAYTLSLLRSRFSPRRK
jgi:hypothetical protein